MKVTPTTTLPVFFRAHYLPLRLRGKSPETTRIFNVCFRRFDKYLGREATLADLTDECVSGLLHWIREQGRAAATVNQCRNHLLALWRFACRKGHVRVWPDVQADPEPERIPSAWTDAELVTIFAACRKQGGTIGGVRADLWWLTLHLILYCTGERIGAVRQLAWENVDLEGGWIRFPAETRKNRLRDRMFRIDAPTIQALKLIEQPQRELVFPWPGANEYLFTKYGKMLEAAGLPNVRRAKFHKMRRTVASMFEARGGNATALLGHSSRRVTEGYLDPKIVQPPQAIDKLPSPDVDLTGPARPDPKPPKQCSRSHDQPPQIVSPIVKAVIDCYQTGMTSPAEIAVKVGCKRNYVHQIRHTYREQCKPRA